MLDNVSSLDDEINAIVSEVFFPTPSGPQIFDHHQAFPILDFVDRKGDCCDVIFG